jgi:hypothetical protein
MTPFAKALRYRRLAARETNKAIVGLLQRLADDFENQARAKAATPRGPAHIVSLSGRLAARAVERAAGTKAA